MRQCGTLALLTSHEQHSSHGGCHTRTDGGHITGDELHRVVDAKTCGHATTRGIDIDRDILPGIHRIQIKQLGLQCVGCIVVDLRTKENDTVHHQT